MTGTTPASKPDVAHVLTIATLACPGCPVGQEARRLAFGPDFGSTLLMVALPLVVVLAIVLAVVRVLDHCSGSSP